jgi:hypothetical protein
VKKVLFAVVLVATCVTAALAADHKPVSIGPYISVPAQPGTPAVMTKDWQPNSKPAAPPFCKGTACLYYSGDFDASNSAANGSCAINNTGLGDDCVLYEAVKPAKTATVAGGAVTILLENTVVGTNPTPFTVYTGVATGKNGKAVCSTKGFAAVAVYGQSGFGITQYSYSIKKLKKTCTLTAGKKYWVVLQPTYDDTSTWGFVPDVQDSPAPNHHGWVNVKDDDFIVYTALGDTTPTPVWGSSGTCGGLGCDVLTLALTGTE